MADDLGIPDIADLRRRVELHRPTIERRPRRHRHTSDETRTPIIVDHIAHRRRPRSRRRRHIVIDDRADRRTISDRHPRRRRQRHRHRLRRLHRHITGNSDRDLLRQHPRRKRDRSGGRGVIHPRDRRPVRRHIPHRHRLIRRLIQRHHKHQIRRTTITLSHRRISNRHLRQRGVDAVGGTSVVSSVVVEDAAEASRRDVEARRRRRCLSQAARGIASDRPHRQHSEPPGSGEVLERLRVGEGEHLGGDIVDPDHRGHAELVPPERLAEFTVERTQLGVCRLRGVDGVGAHGLGFRPAGRRRRLAVVHRHHVDAVEPDTGTDGRAHDVQAVGGQTAGQHRKRVPDLQVGSVLLEQRQRLAAQRDRSRVGHRGTFDVEVDPIQRVGVDDVCVGVGQAAGFQPVSRVPLCEAGSRGSAQRDHHVSAGLLQRRDGLVDRLRLLEVGVWGQRRQPRPRQLAIRRRLQEAQRHQ